MRSLGFSVSMLGGDMLILGRIAGFSDSQVESNIMRYPPPPQAVMNDVHVYVSGRIGLCLAAG